MWASLSWAEDGWKNGERTWTDNINKVMIFCACWLTHTNPICVRDCGGGGGGRFEWQQQIYEALFVSLSKGKWHLYSSVRKTYPDPSIWARKFKAFYCGGLWNRVNSGRNVFACLHVEMLHWYRMFLGILIIIVSRQPKVNFLHSWTVVSPKFPVRSSTCIVKAY